MVERISKKLIFYFAFVLLEISKFVAQLDIFGNSKWIFIGATFWIAVICMLFLIFIEKVNLYEIILLALCGYSYYICRERYIVTLFVVSIASKSIDKEAIVKLWTNIQIGILASCIFIYPVCYWIGLPIAAAGYMGEGRFRYFFFFEHPNGFAVELCFTVMAYVYLNYKKTSFWKNSFLLIVASLFLWVFPNSKTPALLLVVYCLALAIYKYSERLSRALLRYLPFGLILISVFVIYVVAVRNVAWMDIINSVLSGRLDLSIIALSQYKMNLWGQQLSQIGAYIEYEGFWRQLWIDIGYLRMLLACGVILTGFVLYRIIYFYERYIKICPLRAITLAMVFLLAVVEWGAFSIMTAFPLLYVSMSKDIENADRNLWKV